MFHWDSNCFVLLMCKEQLAEQFQLWDKSILWTLCVILIVCTCGTVALVCSVFSPLASGTLPSIGCCCSSGAENSSVRLHTDVHWYTEHTDVHMHTCSWCKEVSWHGHGCERSKQISRRRYRSGRFRSSTTGIQHVHISALSAWNTHTNSH